MRGIRACCLACLLALVLAGCGPARSAPLAYADAPVLARGALPDFSHVMIVMMENLSYRQAMTVPALASLAQRYASASMYFGVSHPSLPNYLAITSGSTWGISSDCWFCYVQAPNLGAQVSASGIPWAAYMQGLPSNCWMGPFWLPSGYAGKHDPFRYYRDIRGNPALCGHIRPLGTLEASLSRGTGLPRLMWVTPNICDDGHNCPATVAANWLVGFVSQVVSSPAWQHGGVLLVTWDEATGGDDRGVDAQGQITPQGGGGHVLTLVIAPDLPRGLTVSVPYNHYSILRTVEQAWGLPALGQAGASGTASLSAFWTH